LTIEGIERELNMLKSAAILRGFRGSPALDVAAAADIISRVGALLRSQPSIREIDLNPVIIYPRGEGALALDALIVIS
jgi:acyl-CoA synthetase (NDP forming)